MIIHSRAFAPSHSNECNTIVWQNESASISRLTNITIRRVYRDLRRNFSRAMTRNIIWNMMFMGDLNRNYSEFISFTNSKKENNNV